MGYESGKVYKIQCVDGHFYYGSCITTLERRSYTHRQRAKQENPTCALYKHIKDKEWKIVLVKSVVCANRNELQKEEDTLIQSSRNDPLCLNTRSAVFNVDKDKERKKQWYIDNREKVLKKAKERWDANKPQ